jgi:DNA-binding LytR/AlgR family response regulator
MSKLKLIIIEDEFFAANHLKKVLKKLGHAVVGIFHSGESFMDQSDLVFDAVIVDIQLSKQLNGLNVAEYLNEQKKPFIFLTANQEQTTLKNAARLNPSAYISKPFKNNDIEAALEMISIGIPDFVRIRTSKGVEYIDPASILFIKADDSYIEISTENGSIIQRKLLKEIVAELPSYFIRVHRSYVVNGKMIRSQTSTHISVGVNKIPISRGLKLDIGGLE